MKAAPIILIMSLFSVSAALGDIPDSQKRPQSQRMPESQTKPQSQKNAGELAQEKAAAEKQLARLNSQQAAIETKKLIEQQEAATRKLSEAIAETERKAEELRAKNAVAQNPSPATKERVATKFAANSKPLPQSVSFRTLADGTCVVISGGKQQAFATEAEAKAYITQVKAQAVAPAK